MTPGWRFWTHGNSASAALSASSFIGPAVQKMQRDCFGIAAPGDGRTPGRKHLSAAHFYFKRFLVSRFED
jgi:hypothetical protein